MVPTLSGPLYPSSSAPGFDIANHQTVMDGTVISGDNSGGGYAALVPNHHTTSEDDDEDDDDVGGGKAGGKSRRELPSGAVATLKSWLLSPEHFTHPYPTPQDQVMLMTKTGIDKKQLKNWFTNARRRIWKPMLKKQLEAGKLAALDVAASSGAGEGGGTPHVGDGGSSMITTAAVHMSNLPGLGGGGGGGSHQVQQQQELPPPQAQAPQQEMYNNFQQAAQNAMNQQRQVQFEQIGQLQSMLDEYGNQVYDQYGNPVYLQQDNATAKQQQQHHPNNNGRDNANLHYDSIGSLAPMTNPNSTSINSMYGMIKTDSHAVLMELFARDQDLVRQAAAGKVNGGSGGAVQAQATVAVQGGGSNDGGTNTLAPPSARWTGSVNNPPPPSSSQKQHSVTFGPPQAGVCAPSLSSWPHFSSVSSLNNLGGCLPGVKSITNLSAADLSSQGNLNKMGNLAQVKSIENMGRFDSFAFLEVFFDDKSGMTGNQSYSTLLGGNGHTHNARGIKREREDQDEAIGLSLDGDEAGTTPRQYNSNEASVVGDLSSSGAPPPQVPDEEFDSALDLKRAYDDALAARGLLSVRRSSENLRELDIPAKMQRTLSQEYIRHRNQGHSMQDFFSTNNSAFAPQLQQFQQLQMQHQQQQQPHPVLSSNDSALVNIPSAVIPDAADPNNVVNTSVEVPSNTNCMLCVTVNVDTQLRPCGHMFHGRCLKPTLANTMGPPKCPICSTAMQSAILAVPTML